MRAVEERVSVSREFVLDLISPGAVEILTDSSTNSPGAVETLTDSSTTSPGMVEILMGFSTGMATQFRFAESRGNPNRLSRVTRQIQDSSPANRFRIKSVKTQAQARSKVALARKRRTVSGFIILEVLISLARLHNQCFEPV